jgi:aspartate dehydrogenase
MRIAFIGFGAINRAVAAGLGGTARMAALTRTGTATPDVAPLADLDAVRAFGPDLVVEAAGHGPAADYVPPLLADGIDVLMASVGVMADPTTEARFRDAPRRGAQLLIPAGAIGGLDMLAALPRDSLRRVTYTGTKPPAAWAGSAAAEGRDLSRLTAPEPLFKGTARQAALRFPKNANVAATLALAGAGFDATEALLVADPQAIGNAHAYSVVSDTAEMSFVVTARPSDTPGTSATTALSLLRAIRNRTAALVI